MKRLIGLFFLVCIVQFSFGQTTFIAVGSGNWNATGVWSTDGFTPIACAPCVSGTDYPGGTDDAYTNGFAITIAGSRFVRDLFVEDVAGSLVFPGSLTVNGVMTGWSGGQFGFPIDLTSNVFTGNSVIIFTAADLSNAGGFNFFNNEVLGSWNNNSPIFVGRFNLSNPGSIDAGFGGGAIRFTAQMVIQSGSLSTGIFMNAIEIGSQLTIGANTTFDPIVPIYGVAGVSSLITQVIVNSGATFELSNSTAYVNANTFRILGTGMLDVGFSGSNQTEGWWYQGNSPTTTNISTTSTIQFSANAAQNIPAIDYGNLSLSGSGTITKILESTGTLKTFGDLSINSSALTFLTSGNSDEIDVDGDIDNNGLWSPTQLVVLSGTSAQSISGNNAITFGGGVRVENTGGTVSLFNQGIDINGTFDIDPSATFDPDVNDVNLSGAFQNDGTLMQGTVNSTFTFDGTTSITGTGTHNFNNVIISNTLTAPSSIMSIAADFTNNGTFNRNGGTATFNGVSAQVIAGSQTFHNLNITNSSATVSNNGTSDISSEGIVTLAANATLDVDGSGSGVFTLLSTGSGDASIGTLGSGASVVGTFHVQRFIDNVENFRYISSPVEGANLGDLQSNNLPITGNFSDASPNGVNGVISSTAPSVFSWDAGTQEYVAADGAGGTVSSFPLSSGTGYALYVYNSLIGADITTQFSGTYPTNGTLSLSDGFNLIGNPYPSGIDWTAVSLSGGASTTVSIKDNTGKVASAGNFVTYTQAGVSTPGGFDGIISSGQSVWVESTGVGTITIDENHKATSTEFFREEIIPNILRIQMHNEDETVFDETVIVFNDEASDGHDLAFDGKKRKNDEGTFNIFSLDVASETVEQAIQTVPTSGCAKLVKINMDNVSGNYSLKFTDFDTFDFATNILLKDNLLNESIAVDASTVYPFEIIDSDVTTYEGRFEIEFSAASINTSLNLSTEDSCSDKVLISINNSQQGLNYSLNLGGETVTSTMGTGGEIELNVAASALAEGENIFDVNVGNTSCGMEETILNAVTVNYVPIVEVSSVNDGSECSMSTVTISATGAPVDGYYRWYETADAVEAISGENASSFTTPELDITRAYFVTIVNSKGCESDTRIPVNAIIHISEPLQTPDVVADGNVDCSGEDALIYVNNSQIGVSYNLRNAEGSIATVIGDGDQVILSVPKSTLNNGTNTFNLNLNNGECGDEMLIMNAVSVTHTGISEITKIVDGSTCGSGNITLSAEGAPEDGHYKWYESVDADDAIFGENESNFITSELDVSKTYFVSVVNSLGCESSARIAVTAVINELPTIPEITIEDNILVSTSKTGNQWYKDNILIEGATSNTYEVVESGSYTVVNAGSNGCSVGSEAIVMTITATIDEEELVDNSLVIYPNPIDGDKDLIISIKDPENFVYQHVLLYNNMGKLMITQEISLDSEIKIDMNSFNKGIYFIHLTGDKGNTVYKILKK